MKRTLPYALLLSHLSHDGWLDSCLKNKSKQPWCQGAWPPAQGYYHERITSTRPNMLDSSWRDPSKTFFYLRVMKKKNLCTSRRISEHRGQEPSSDGFNRSCFLLGQGAPTSLPAAWVHQHSWGLMPLVARKVGSALTEQLDHGLWRAHTRSQDWNSGLSVGPIIRPIISSGIPEVNHCEWRPLFK